jgi:hypothetical protein
MIIVLYNRLKLSDLRVKFLWKFFNAFKTGQEEFDAITKAYYRGMKSFLSLQYYWNKFF